MPHRTTQAAPALLLVATLALALFQVMPKPGLPVVLLFPPGTAQDRALLGVLSEPGWVPVAVRANGPFILAVASPAVPGASAFALRRAAGAWAALHLPGRAACATHP